MVRRAVGDRTAGQGRNGTLKRNETTSVSTTAGGMLRDRAGHVHALVKSPQEVFDGFFFRPEVAEQLGRVRRELGALVSYEFLNRWMTSARVLFSHSLVSAGPVHENRPRSHSSRELPVPCCRTAELRFAAMP